MGRLLLWVSSKTDLKWSCSMISFLGGLDLTSVFFPRLDFPTLSLFDSIFQYGNPELFVGTVIS